MDTSSADWPSRFPRLFASRYVDHAAARVAYVAGVAPDELVSRLAAYWAYAVGRVHLTGPPLNPPDGETVVEVLTLQPQEAAEYLDEEDPIQADVVRHADAMGLIRGLA